MNNNIMLHGATNCNSSNYGDFIYGDMIYSYFKNLNCNVLFYQPSNFFKNYLNNYKDNKPFNKKQSNLDLYNKYKKNIIFQVDILAKDKMLDLEIM